MTNPTKTTDTPADATPASPSDPLAPRSSLLATSAPIDSFLAELLADQQQLQTPAARAAAVMDAQPAAFRGDRFRDLIPLSAPGPDEQYAFEVDLDACSGCKACVSGCHSLNGLDDHETWRDVGLVFAAPAFQQTVTTACHHCADPACLNGCPVLAYEKDPVTGIVRHLDDQCIGCSYCVLKCPYDVPKYNERLGIVRKCDLCHGRLAEGEAPACVQACPTHAIKIVTVPTPHDPQSTTHDPQPPIPLTSLAADPSYTRPSTRYVSKRPLPSGLRAADADTLRPQHAHYALVFLLTLTQLGTGLLAASLLAPPPLPPTLAIAAAFLFTAGLAASVFHLGQPFRAWRIFLGLRRSWLSREAVVLGAAFPLILASAIIPLLPPSSILYPLSSIFFPIPALGAASLGIACSAMIYIDTRRRFWRPTQSFGRMFGTVVVAALTTIPPAAALSLAAKLALEASTLRGPSHSARLQRGPLRAYTAARFLCGIAAAVLWLAAPDVWFAAVAVFMLGELLERTLYFRAVDSPKMPGLPAS